jgi:hypothetical protein
MAVKKAFERELRLDAELEEELHRHHLLVSWEATWRR